MQYVTNGRDSGIIRDGVWFEGLGTGPSVEQTLAAMKLALDMAVKLAGRFDWLFVRGSRKPFQLEWLRKLGINPFSVIFEDGLAWYELEEMVYADNGDVSVTHPGYGGHPEIVRRIRDAAKAIGMGAPLTGSLPSARMLYISRSDGGGRGIINEAEVVAMLEVRGFEVVSLSKLSLDEQIALFATAKIVVGVHGAGLMNIIFMQPNAAVVELLHHRYGTKSYSLPALPNGLRYFYLTCAGHQGEELPATASAPSDASSFVTAPLWVNVDDLARAIDGL